jgi:hypothetical protein
LKKHRKQKSKQHTVPRSHEAKKVSASSQSREEPSKDFLASFRAWIQRQKLIKRLLLASSAVLAPSFVYLVYTDYHDGKFGGQVALTLSGAGLNESTPTYFFYTVPEDSNEARHLVPISLTIHNTHKFQDTNVTLSIRYNKINHRALLPRELSTHSGSRSANELTYEINSSDKYDHVNYQIQSLPSHASFDFSDGAMPSLNEDPKLPPVFFSGQGLDIQATTFSAHDVKRNWNVRYRGMKLGNTRQLEWYMKTYYASHIVLETRKNSGFWEYLAGLLSFNTVTAYGFDPNLQLAKESNIYVPTTKPEEYISINFKPYAWSLLLEPLFRSDPINSPT